MARFFKMAFGLFLLGLMSFQLCPAQTSGCKNKPRFDVEVSANELKRLKARITEFTRAYQTEDLDQITKVLPASSAGEREAVNRRYSIDLVRRQIHDIAAICLSTVSAGRPHYFAAANGTVIYKDRTRRPEAIFFYIGKSTDQRIQFEFTELMFTSSDIFELAPAAPILPN